MQIINLQVKKIIFQEAYDLELNNVGFKVFKNLPVSKLVEHAIKSENAELTNTGALCINTGKYTGRSPDDRFVVNTPSVADKVDWGKVNVPFEKEKYEKLLGKIESYIKNKNLYVFDGFVGADLDNRLSVRVINEFASHNLFVQQLFIKPTEEELKKFEPDFTIISAPDCLAVPEENGTNSEAYVILNLEDKKIIIGGTRYCGEMKKSIFSVMNYILPQKGIMPMHCSANKGEKDDVALFFGLSGTGKTTLSADPTRKLIGDDEHGWSDKGVFNFEGGCYAKCINLNKENEPQIWDAIRFGTIVENLVIDPITGVPDYTSEKYTENTRAGYPINYIDNADLSGQGGHPKCIIFLTADASGILPPISKLTKEQAMYHFMSGYTSKLAGTERGITAPTATFSTCFGAPFMPLRPQVYAELLGKKINEHEASVFLVNTGWNGTGKRMKISYTRAMVNAAIEGKLENVDYDVDSIFNLFVPKECPGVPSEVLNPINSWENKEDYQASAIKLAGSFKKNFEKFKNVSDSILNAGPTI